MIAFYLVYEAQTRGCLHFHGLFWGSIPSSLFQYGSDKPELCKRIAAVIDSCVEAVVNDHIHLYQLQLKALQKEKRFKDSQDFNNNIVNSASNNDGTNKAEKYEGYRGTMHLDNLAIMDISSNMNQYLKETEEYKNIFRRVQFSEDQINEMFKDVKSLFKLHVELTASTCNFHKHSCTCHKGKFCFVYYNKKYHDVDVSVLIIDDDYILSYFSLILFSFLIFF